MIELKPCPFCGSKPKAKVEEVSFTKFGLRFETRIFCEECGTEKRGIEYTTDYSPTCCIEAIKSSANGATADWNRRSE